jgi:hypothetical protein
MGQQLLVGQGFLIFDASGSYSDTSHSVGLLWTSDLCDANTGRLPDNTHNRQTFMLPAGFEPASPASERLT